MLDHLILLPKDGERGMRSLLAHSAAGKAVFFLSFFLHSLPFLFEGGKLISKNEKCRLCD